MLNITYNNDSNSNNNDNGNDNDNYNDSSNNNNDNGYNNDNNNNDNNNNNNNSIVILNLLLQIEESSRTNAENRLYWHFFAEAKRKNETTFFTRTIEREKDFSKVSSSFFEKRNKLDPYGFSQKSSSFLSGRTYHFSN